jgi:MFS family permease
MGFFLGPFVGSFVYTHGSYSTMFLTMLIPVAAAAVFLVLAWPGYMKVRTQLEREETA